MRTTGAARVIDTAAPPCVPRSEVGWDLERNGNGMERGEGVQYFALHRDHSWNALLSTRPTAAEQLSLDNIPLPSLH